MAKVLKPPINLISLLKCSPTYRKRILEYLFPDPTIETEEGAPPARQPSRRQVRSRTPPDGEESEPEENSRSPVRRLRNRDIWHGTPDELFKSLFDEAVPQGIDEARQIIDAAISYGPSIRMAAFVGKLYLHDLLVDCGAEVTLITLSPAQKILEANPDMSIKYDRSLNIRGVVEETTTKGYLIAELEFGQAVKAKEVLYILRENILNTELLLSKLFPASINAMISMRHDYMMVPTLSGVPVIIHGNKYVGDHHCLAKDLVPSKAKLIASAAVIDATKKEIEIEMKHLKKCASVIVEDWSYFKGEEETDEETIGDEKEIEGEVKDIEEEEKEIKEVEKEIKEEEKEIKEEKKEIKEEKETDREEIGGEKKTDEEEIGEGKTYELEEYCFEEDLEFEAELAKANSKRWRKRNHHRWKKLKTTH
ncbi:hypothetical protein BDD12DRAFT_901507 [Trichophaea hybrida]|nr:hypothetical protein BDD12DRAFT_901507 [Trichophaea hybrida]